jgi:hypothetical protein
MSYELYPRHEMPGLPHVPNVTTASCPPLASSIPRRPWLLSKQYAMTFVLSQDNEIIMGDTACKHLGDEVLRYIIAAVNVYSPNAQADL